MISNEIRREFLNFFKQRGHLVQPSAPLAINDPELLFTIAGMVPFKTFFLGEKTPPASRITSCQLCFRTNDLDRVGQTPYHHTFFEMLGNFSFGDYFKKEACEWGWEFITNWLGLDKSHIWITIFREDEETYQIWKKIGIPSSRILRRDEKDNFWALAEVGPCGPDTEIFFDRGEKFGCGKVNCEPGCDCRRWVEVWNLVFMQFNRDEKGKLSPLPRKNIDTGMGLERVTSVVQGTGDDYQTDLFTSLLGWLKDLSLSKRAEEKFFRIICDHLRALTFLLGEGILPSNTGRGYVVRRILRRASRYGRKIGLEDPFLYKGVPVVIKTMEEPYPHLKKVRGEIVKIIKGEEESFQSTLIRGMGILERIIDDLRQRGEKLISSRDVFKLYDTYGFPLDLTEEIATEEGLKIDTQSVEKLLNEQKRWSREDFKEKKRSIVGTRIKAQISSLKQCVGKVEFKGYETLRLKTSLVGIVKEGVLVDEINEEEEGQIILASTPFYPEGGGQVGDKGRIFTVDSEADVLDTQEMDEVILHQVRVLKGKLRKDDKVMAEVDAQRRKAISRAHTSTHLLQATLRKILGKGVKQSGSLVEEDRLRFDFTHPFPLSEKEIEKVSLLLNEKIREDLPITVEETTLEEASKRGAIALFEERYGEKVRVVSIGDFSREVCGGTHLCRSGEIGLVKVISEEGIASGVRRIEALVGEKALEWSEKREKLLRKIISKLRTSDDKVLSLIEERERKLRDKEKELKKWQRRLLDLSTEKLIKQALCLGRIKIVKGKWEGISSEILRELAEKMRDKLKEGIVVLASVGQGKVFLAAASTQENLPANQILKEVARLGGGSAGGRWDFAQGGTSQPSRVDQALEKLPAIVKNFVSQS